jgi:hypothetical protein
LSAAPALEFATLEQLTLSFEEIVSLIEDDIRWMASAAQSFEDIAQRMPDGEERTHLQFLAARYHECEGIRKGLIEKMRRQTPAS